MNSTAADSNDLVPKLIASGVVAAIVGAVGAISGIGVMFIVVAIAATAGAFWLLDALMQPSQVRGLGLAPGAGAEAPKTAGPVDLSASPSSSDKRTATLDPALFDPQSVEIKTNLQGKSRVFSVRIAKHGNAIAECEDAVAVDPRRGVLAVADGASSSFGAGTWADTLSKQFVKSPPKPLSVSSFAEWLGQARATTPEVDGGGSHRPTGWWSEEGARQGAFSTVVGAAIMSDGGLRGATVMCLGDSCAFVLTGAIGQRVVRRSLPYEDAEQFGSHPSLLGSLADRQHDEPTWTTVPTAPGDLLVLASDAVSEWLLGDPKRFQLFDGSEPEAIASRLIAERTDGRIVNDDLTVAVLELAA